jgi:hypothetical protein
MAQVRHSFLCVPVLSSRLQRSLYILWGDHLAPEKTLSRSIQISGNLLSLGKSNIRHSVTTMRRLDEAEFDTLDRSTLKLSPASLLSCIVLHHCNNPLHLTCPLPLPLLHESSPPQLTGIALPSGLLPPPSLCISHWLDLSFHQASWVNECCVVLKRSDLLPVHGSWSLTNVFRLSPHAVESALAVSKITYLLLLLYLTMTRHSASAEYFNFSSCALRKRC